MKAFHLLLILAAATFVSCERHDFEETKKLSEHHGAEHAEGAAGEHAVSAEHGEESKGEHAPKTEH